MAKYLVLIMFLLQLPALCIAEQYNKKLDQLMINLNETVTDLKIKTVSVADFSDTSSRRYEVSGILEQELSRSLTQHGRFKIILETTRESSIKELKFGAAGYTDQMTAKPLGKMSQADAILTCTYWQAQ